MNKMYFLKGEEDFCYPLSYWKKYMVDNKLKQIELYQAKRVTGVPYFYCKQFGEIGVVKESCGKICDKYIPNNGKNGRCKHYGYCYEKSPDKLIVLRA
ncbi:MAG: hypothetical protein KatS3mg035_1006 [Bacteroidia bacterium]|nr:MAG: hypothetical protein KatS3mg035_1006 [Bacteroidia bacterium]